MSAVQGKVAGTAVLRVYLAGAGRCIASGAHCTCGRANQPRAKRGTTKVPPYSAGKTVKFQGMSVE